MERASTAWAHETKITIRPAAPEDLPCLARLRRDNDVQHSVLGYPSENIPTDEDVRAWIKRKSEDDGGCFFTVADTDGQAVGFVQLHGVHRAGRFAQFGVAIVGAARGKGYAADAVREIIDRGKQRWRLAKVMCEVRADNQASRRMVTKLGFSEVGTLRAHYLGHDVMIYEKLLSQW